MWGLLSTDILVGQSVSDNEWRGEHRAPRPSVSLAQINNFIRGFVDIDTQLLGNMFTAP